jgi:hypothetical protein
LGFKFGIKRFFTAFYKPFWINYGIFVDIFLGKKHKDNLRLQLMYSTNKGSYDGWYYGYQLDGDVTYSKINVIVGFEY